jgi:hypothetical protein
MRQRHTIATPCGIRKFGADGFWFAAPHVSGFVLRQNLEQHFALNAGFSRFSLTIIGPCHNFI